MRYYCSVSYLDLCCSLIWIFQRMTWYHQQGVPFHPSILLVFFSSTVPFNQLAFTIPATWPGITASAPLGLFSAIMIWQTKDCILEKGSSEFSNSKIYTAFLPYTFWDQFSAPMLQPPVTPSSVTYSRLAVVVVSHLPLIFINDLHRAPFSTVPL